MRTTPRSGWPFLLSALLLTASVFAVLWHANDAPHVKAVGERYVVENDARLLVVDPVQLQPGLGVSLPGWLMTKYSRAHGAVDFYLVAEGDAARMLAGDTPTRVYHHEPASRGFPPTVFVWPDAGARVLEAVWKAEASDVPALDRSAIAANARNTQDDIYLVDPSLAPLLRPILGLIAIAAVLTLATGFFWMRGSATPRFPEEAEAGEALVHLIELGRIHLSRMLRVMHLTAGLLVFSGIAGAWGLFSLMWSASGSIHFEPLMPLLMLGVMGGAVLAYASAWAVWARHYVDLRRELARWSARARAPPAILVG